MRRSLRPKLGATIPSWCGSSIPCGGGLRRQPNRIRRTSPSQNLKTPCKSAFSPAPRTWTASTSRQVRGRLFTCTESFSRAAATLAAALLLTTRISTSRQPKSPGVNAAARFARTSAGSAKCRLNWIESIAHWIDVLLYGHRNVGCGPARCQFCCSSQWSCADNLRWAGEACERILVHGLLFGQSRGDIANRPLKAACSLAPANHIVVQSSRIEKLHLR